MRQNSNLRHSYSENITPVPCHHFSKTSLREYLYRTFTGFGLVFPETFLDQYISLISFHHSVVPPQYSCRSLHTPEVSRFLTLTLSGFFGVGGGEGFFFSFFWLSFETSCFLTTNQTFPTVSHKYMCLLTHTF